MLPSAWLTREHNWSLSHRHFGIAADDEGQSTASGNVPRVQNETTGRGQTDQYQNQPLQD